MSAECTLSAGGAPLARIKSGASDGRVVAVALHAGHLIRPELEDRIAITPAERLREEDPYTADMVPPGVELIEALRSRFEVDLNRPRFRAVYQGPSDSWGMRVWDGELPDIDDRVSRSVYDAFYAAAFDHLSGVAEKHGRFVVLDLHSYNHRREGADAPVADPAENPEINLGTGRLDRIRWAPVIEAFRSALSDEGFDVRENVKFRGGHFAHWVSDTFPDSGCALAIEFKKTYMDEWTGAVDESAVARIRSALSKAVRDIEAVLPEVR